MAIKRREKLINKCSIKGYSTLRVIIGKSDEILK